jgi:signal peptidase I
VSTPAVASPRSADLDFGPARRIRRAARRAQRKNAHPHAQLPWDLRVLFVVIVVAILAEAGWLASGGSLFRVDSPSMCPQVCVGALVLDRPLAPGASVQKGETVTFVPPGFTVEYTHRVVKVFANGTFETKGDASNIVDPWVVSPAELKGVTVATVWGLGWLSSALPFLAAGMALILLFRRSIDVRVRRAYDRLLAVILIIVPIWLIKPLIRAMVIQTSSLKHGMERLTIVNTGLLPSQFRASGGQFKDFVASGQRISLVGPVQPSGQVAVSQFVSFHWLGWTIVAVVIASPLLLFLLQLPRQRKLAVQHAGPTLAERLAAEYPEEVLAAAFARVSGLTGPPTSLPRTPVVAPAPPPRALNADVESFVGESVPAPPAVPLVESPVVEPETAPSPEKKKKGKKGKKKKRKDKNRRADEKPFEATT